MSYINNHKAAYEKLQSIKEVDAQHISLYHAFFYQFNKFGWPDHLLIPRDNLMFMAKIGSTNTFYKKVRQLNDWGFIKYEPSNNPLIGSRYTYIKCDTTTDTTTDTTGGISTDTTTDTTSETLIRPKDNKTKRPKDNSKSVFSFRQSLIDYGFEEQLVSDWLQVRKKKKASNTKTAFNNFISQVEKSKMDINTLLEIIVVKNWVGFNHKWLDNLEIENKEFNREQIIEQCIKQLDAKTYIRQIEEKQKFKLDKRQLAKDYLHACEVRGKKLNPYNFPGWISRNQLWIIETYKPKS